MAEDRTPRKVGPGEPTEDAPAAERRRHPRRRSRDSATARDPRDVVRIQEEHDDRVKQHPPNRVF